MHNLKSFFLGSLLAMAIFIICNCAGYLIVTFAVPYFIVEDKTVANSVQVTPASISQTQVDAEVVTFTTPTATFETILPTPTPILTAETSPLPPTPIPLLPTVTLVPTINTPLPTATLLPTPTSTATPPLSTPIVDSLPPTVQKQTNRAVAQRQVVDLSQLEILSHQSYVDTLGWHHIVGEVQNNSELPIEFVEVIAKLYDATNDLIGTKLTFTTPDVIYPGGKAPFDVITLRPSQWQRIHEYKLQIKAEIAEELINQRLVLLNQNSYIQNDFLYVTGEVHNTGDRSALVKLIVTLYDVDHQVINTNWSYADLGIIPINHISPFQVKIAHTTDPNNFSYQIQIEEEAIDVELDFNQEDTN